MSYSNLPNVKDKNSLNRIFNLYSAQPTDINSNVLTAMLGFFTNRGFDSKTGEQLAVIIIEQAKKDGYNPMEILDTLKNLDNLEINSLAIEILNFNRINTSFLGFSTVKNINFDIKRNILA
jgi:hypothetical protein